jgi:hypothetical protein
MTVKRLTNSEMSTWRDCRRKWWLSYYRGLKLKGGVRFNTAISIGNRVHAALAAYYDPAVEADPVQHVKDAVAADLREHPDQDEALQKELDLCLTMVEGYVEWLAEEGADAEYTAVLGSEDAVEVPLMDDVTLLAKLDVRVEDHKGDRRGLDHKTGTHGVEPRLLQINTQSLTQHLVEFMKLKAEGREAEVTKGTVFNFLRKSKRTARAKPPFYWREPVNHNEDELRSHWKHVVAIARDMQTAEWRLRNGEDHHTVVYPSPGTDCGWKCPFFKICALFDDGSDVESAIEDLYELHDPLDRYKEKTS